MHWEKPNFGNPEERIENNQEEEMMEEKLAELSKELAEKTRQEGFPVTEDCRIDMAAFNGVYSAEEIKKDSELVKRYEKEWYKNVPTEEIKGEKLKRSGEKLELLKGSIFSKFLGDEFVVVRASSYDDINNKVDNVVLEKETGNLVCAFDEVAESSGQRYEKKKEQVLGRNSESRGGSLKYGFKLEKDEEDQIRLVLGKVDFLPIFYMPLPERHIKEGIKQLTPLGEKSIHEEKLFTYFVSILLSQANYLELN